MTLPPSPSLAFPSCIYFSNDYSNIIIHMQATYFLVSVRSAVQRHCERSEFEMEAVHDAVGHAHDHHTITEILRRNRRESHSDVGTNHEA